MSHPVLSVIGARVATGSRPGERTDGHRVALVVEGGGMRGIVSAAMTAAIEDLGLLDAFDLAVGTSAGALNAAALLAGVAGGCTDEYAEGFTTRGFINPARVLLGRPVVNVEYVIDFNSHRLDAGRHARTAASPIPLHCIATDVDTCAAADLTGLTELADLRAALLATSRLPWIGGDPVRYRGRRWLDGGLSEPVPVRTALAAGATHLLVLMTRSHGAVMTNGGGLGDRLLQRRLHALNPDLVGLYRRRSAGYAAITEEVLAATNAPGSAPPYLMGIALPAGSPVPSRLDRDPARLHAAATLAHRVARETLTMCRG
ncbi:MAG TPA: patatin-like phospholipase family protein [Actinophytocola sp.]|uniref:patatin-like phospholipase family protein n=1 Tax=Actinophytocola sp. TaxID=1872138 RepID=UPI002DBCA85F|nr:patatin-like phospholipase family protein [Actinophytocola sp.]HEU5474448.1 patatin-like phospholipase family protein [Actinophytocola sp.]